MILGVDIADEDGNGNVGWAKAKLEGPLSFVILRACFGTWVDTMFAAYQAAAEAAGVRTASYLFLRFPHLNGPAVPSPEEQAQAFAKTILPLKPGRLPPTIAASSTTSSQTPGFIAVSTNFELRFTGRTRRLRTAASVPSRNATAHESDEA